jgi:hypothetical protein
MSLGELLDAAACGLSGHIWVQHPEAEGVLACTRCGEQAEAAPPPEAPATEEESLVPEFRPWLEPPYLFEA